MGAKNRPTTKPKKAVGQGIERSAYPTKSQPNITVADNKANGSNPATALYENVPMEDRNQLLYKTKQDGKEGKNGVSPEDFYDPKRNSKPTVYYGSNGKEYGNVDSLVEKKMQEARNGGSKDAVVSQTSKGGKKFGKGGKGQGQSGRGDEPTTKATGKDGGGEAFSYINKDSDEFNKEAMDYAKGQTKRVYSGEKAPDDYEYSGRPTQGDALYSHGSTPENQPDVYTKKFKVAKEELYKQKRDKEIKDDYDRKTGKKLPIKYEALRQAESNREMGVDDFLEDDETIKRREAIKRDLRKKRRAQGGRF